MDDKPAIPGMSSKDEAKRPSGTFYFEGAPITRKTLMDSSSTKYKKKLLCGYCGIPLKYYKCPRCEKTAPRSQEDPTRDHEEILDAWRDGEYHTNVQRINNPRTPQPSVYEPGKKSISQLTLPKGMIAEGSSSVVFADDTQSRIPKRDLYEDHILRAKAGDKGPLFDNLEWTAALLMGWRSHDHPKVRPGTKFDHEKKPFDDEHGMTYDFRRHLFLGNRTDDHFKMRPRTKKQFVAETAYERLWLPSEKEQRLGKALLTGTFDLRGYKTLEDPREKTTTDPGWKRADVQQPYSKRFAHLLYGPGSERDPKKKGYLLTAKEREEERLRKEREMKLRLLDGGATAEEGGKEGASLQSDSGALKTDMDASLSPSTLPRSRKTTTTTTTTTAAAAAVVPLASSSGQEQLHGGTVRVSRQKAVMPFRPYRSTGGEDRPHHVHRSRDLRRMKM